MKALKTWSVFCLIITLNCIFNSNILAQDTQTNMSPAKATTSVQELKEEPSNNSSQNQLPNVQQRDDKYRIGFQDTLEITIFRHPELSQVVNVSPDGTILMPRIDKPIVAVCKTERELKASVETLYKNYLKNPFVNVRAVQQLSQPFAVIGAVEKPGSFYLNRKIRLLELLAFAGGPKVDKAGAKIQVARVGNVAGCTENIEGEDTDKQVVFLGFKTNDVMAGKENPWMQPGDIVSVLEAEEAYVVGNVNKPSKISLKETVTLTQAIAIAEGLDDTAKTDKVVIQRQASGSQIKTEIAYNLKDIRDKKVPDPVLEPNDIVEVSNDKNKSLRKGIFEVIKGGIPSILYRIP